jgi:hypothetical protein
LLHNVESAYPTLEPAATARNTNDWDLSIDPATPAGHIADLEVTFLSGSNEWVVPVTLPIDCDPGPPPGPLPGTFSVASITIDDGIRGDSIGNNDRVAQCGETIELYVELAGLGSERATASLAILDDRLTLRYNATAGYVASGSGSAENDNDWDIRIDPTVPDGLSVIMALEVTVAGGATETLSFPLVVSCPGAEPAQPIAVSSVTVDDGIRGDSVGNNDRFAQCGETIELYVVLSNRGSIQLDGVEATFTTTDPYLTLLFNATSPYGDIPADGTAENSNDWDLRISATTPDGHTASFQLTVVTASGDRWTVATEIPITCS